MCSWYSVEGFVWRVNVEMGSVRQAGLRPSPVICNSWHGVPCRLPPPPRCCVLNGNDVIAMRCLWTAQCPGSHTPHPRDHSVSRNSRHVSFPVGKTKIRHFSHPHVTLASYFASSQVRITAQRPVIKVFIGLVNLCWRIMGSSNHLNIILQYTRNVLDLWSSREGDCDDYCLLGCDAHIIRLIVTNISEELSASIFRV
jgi:hypothetical protein